MPASVAERVEVWAPQVKDLLDLVGDVAFVAGGAARQVVMRGEAPAAEDVDLFLIHPHLFGECCYRLEAAGYRYNDESAFSRTFLPRNPGFELPVQVIRPFRDDWSLTYGTPEEVISHFSFTTEMFALQGSGAVIGPTAREDTVARRLVLQNITNPLWVSLRAMKYAAKGYWFTPGEMRRVLDAWMDRPQQRRSAR